MIEIDTPDGVRAVFSTREGGVSTGAYSSLNLGPNTDDTPAAVTENWRILAEGMGLRHDALVANRQVHGRDVRVVDDPAGPAVDGDGLVTNRRHVGLLALGADCLPVLIWRMDGSAVGAAHVGWRGVLAGVIGATAQALGGGPLGAAIGPGIGPCCYPVGDDIRTAFLDDFGPGVVDGRVIAVARAAEIALERAGVDRANLQVIDRCTACEPDHFFSYRRDGALSGRQAGLVWRT